MLLVSGTTRTMANLAEQGASRLGHLVTPRSRDKLETILATGLPWAIDNGAYRGFNSTAFTRLLQKAEGKPRLLFVACPDVVGDSAATMQSFLDWSPALHRMNLPVAFVGQDGVEDRDDVPWGEFSTLFVGGSTDWKLSDAARDLCHEAKRRGKWIHMGRVNSLRRMKRAQLFGCDSIDGSSASMFGDTHIPKYLRWLEWLDRQAIMWLEG